MVGMLYGIMGLLFIPFFLLIFVFGHDSLAPRGFGMIAIGGTAFAFLFPIFYGVLGFVFGALGAFVYNLIAKWLGGIEVEVE
jgi:hypothetical protein